MNMTFTDPTPSLPATSLHRQQQKRKENALRGQPKSKKELEASAEAARLAALSTSLDPRNRGARMMAKLGFKGGSLGKSSDARTEPIELAMKEDRGGIGMDSEKKKRVREAMEERVGREKRVKADEGEFRERQRREREERRCEGLVWGAMKVAEGLDGEGGKEDGEAGVNGGASTGTAKSRPNVLWRQLVRSRDERDRERRMRHEVHDSLSKLPRLADPEEDPDDKLAYGNEVEELEEVQEDPELDEFWALESAEKLQRIVEYLRTTYNYCFWCKFRYPDATMEGCPGVTEEEHD